LHPKHRPAVEEIVRATGVFSEGEVRVAMEVFDEGLKAEMENGEWRMGESLSPRPILHSPLPQLDYELIGVFQGALLLGYACFGPTPATDRTYDLYWIAVLPDAQRTGAGGALMAEVERQLASRPARLLVIETSSREDYAPTRRFYDKLGYQEAARLRDFYAPGDDRVVLSKRMTAGQGPLPA
jgi:ribosomal protein S18 acetylase RimI-like enzyme